MGFFAKLGKYSLIFVNFIFVILGCTLISFGIWLMFGAEDSEIRLTYVAHNITFLHTTLIVIGSLTTIISFVGLLGAIKESTWMLKTYGWVSLFLLFFQMWSAIFIAYSSYGESMGESGMSEFNQMFNQYGLNNGDTLLVNTIQTTFKCCGYDYPETTKFDNGTYPWSCCSSNGLACLEPAYTEGCVSRIWKVMSPIIFTASIVYYVILAIQILCIFIAFAFASSVAKKLSGKQIYYNL